MGYICGVFAVEGGVVRTLVVVSHRAVAHKQLVVFVFRAREDLRAGQKCERGGSLSFQATGGLTY